MDKIEKHKTPAKALLVARFDGDPTPRPGRRARKMEGNKDIRVYYNKLITQM